MALDSLYRQVQADRLQRFEAALASGAYRPFVWPWDTLPALWLFLGMLILPRLPQNRINFARVPLLLLILGQGLWSCLRCRSIGMAGGYGIGLANDWGLITTVGFLCFGNLKRDYQRLALASRDMTKTEIDANGAAQSSATTQVVQPMPRLRATKPTENPHPAGSSASGALDTDKLVWQSYPDDIRDCIGWLVDLITSFRGVNWNWRLAILSPADAAPKLPQNANHPTPSGRSTAAFATPTTIRAVQIQAIKQFLLYYIGVDLAKTLVIHDPYHLGLVPIDDPHPLWLLQPYPTLSRVVRLLISLFSVVMALSFIVRPLPFPHHPAS
jgi:hypothetical protein